MDLIGISIDISNEIGFFKEQISSELKNLDSFERFVSENETFLTENPDKEEQFFHFAYHQFHSFFPYMINNTLLVTFDSYLEYKLKLICFNQKIEIIRPKNKKKSDIELIYKAISNSLIKDNLVQKRLLKEIISFHKLRNLIVHYNSHLSKTFMPNVSELSEIKKNVSYKFIKSKKNSFHYNEITTCFYIIDLNILKSYLDLIEQFLFQIVKQF